jgi:hypothetical protein
MNKIHPLPPKLCWKDKPDEWNESEEKSLDADADDEYLI